MLSFSVVTVAAKNWHTHTNIHKMKKTLNTGVRKIDNVAGFPKKRNDEKS